MDKCGLRIGSGVGYTMIGYTIIRSIELDVHTVRSRVRSVLG